MITDTHTWSERHNEAKLHSEVHQNAIINFTHNEPNSSPLNYVPLSF